MSVRITELDGVHDGFREVMYSAHAKRVGNVHKNSFKLFEMPGLTANTPVFAGVSLL